MRALYSCLVLILLSRAAFAQDLDLTTYRNRALGITLEAPEGWLVFEQTGYPEMLALMVPEKHQASISLALGPEGSAKNIKKLTSETRITLLRLGLTPTREGQVKMGGRTLHHLDLAQTNVELRQLFIPYGNRTLILTLTSGKKRMPRDLYALERVLELMSLTGINEKPTEQNKTISDRPNPSSAPSQPATEELEEIPEL